MKVNIKKQNGITLVALVVTIIVLLILAAVSLSMVFNQGGIFNRAEQATEKYSQAKAQEELTLALGEAQMRKYDSGLTEEELNEEIEKVGSLLPKEDPSSSIQQVIVDGYIFEVDRTVPKILDYIGPANGVIVTATITQNGNWQNPTATVTGSITKYGGGSVTSSTATATNGVTISSFPTAGGEYTIANITTDTDITITAVDSEGKTANKTIHVKLVRDNTPPTISGATATAAGMKIKISVRATDNESGLKQINYSVSPTTITPNSNTITSGQEVELTATAEGKYTITFTATDNAGNTSTATAEATTVDGGVLKHIKTTAGLKEVNTKDIYGATVNGYSCTRTGTEWQIFYIDEEDNNRVYLISKEYMAPPTTGTEMTKGSYSHTYYWNTTVLNKYTGTIPSTAFTQKFLRDYAGTSASANNLQATNYMLDQAMWSEYKGAKADYAFGGPTLPLFQASYNDTCRTATKLGIQKSGTGYQVKIGTGSWTTGQSGYGDTNTQKGIYFKGTSGNPAYGMWLASPSSTNAGYVLNADYSGRVYNYTYYSNYLGFRPVVSLQSTVQFTANADGSYTIAN